MEKTIPPRKSGGMEYLRNYLFLIDHFHSLSYNHYLAMLKLVAWKTHCHTGPEQRSDSVIIFPIAENLLSWRKIICLAEILPSGLIVPIEH